MDRYLPQGVVYRIALRAKRLKGCKRLNPGPRVGLIAYEYPPLIGGMATYARALVRHLHACGYDVHVFANQRAESDSSATVHPILTTDLVRDLPRLSRFDMDLWHAINFGYAPLATFKRPFVLTVHGTDFLTPWVRCTMDRVPVLWRTSGWFKRRTVRRGLYMPALRCVDDLLVCSRFSAQLFRREYPSVGRLQVIPNGVDDSFFQTPGEVARHPRRLLTVCNLDVANRRKNVDGVLRAMALVGDRLDLQYRIVGDGPERAALESLTQQLEIGHRIQFLGRISNSELGDAYASSSLFVLVPRPRPGDVEGFGIVYLEAAAAGTPSLASRCGGAADAVADGRSGFFTADPSPAAIADGLIRFFEGRVRFDHAEVREHAARYAWTTVLDRVQRVYERLLPAHLSRRAAGGLPPSQPVKRTPMPKIRSVGEQDWNAWIERVPQIRTRNGPGGRALLISYMFPPTGGSAVQRPAKLVKHLPEFGWTAEVLTADHGRFPWFDESLQKDVPLDCHVHRVPGHEPACLAKTIASVLECATGTDSLRSVRIGIEDGLWWRLTRLLERLGVEDAQSLWVRPAMQDAVRHHRRNPFDVVISTGPPHFAHRVGMGVARATGLPWVADVRDPLVSDFNRRAAGRRQLSAMRRLERLIMRHADMVVTTCPSLADDFRVRYPHRSAASIRSITNGFDRDDLRAVAGSQGSDSNRRQECVFVAAGSFYGQREIARIVGPMQRVLDRHPEWEGRVRLIIAGTLDGEQRRRWEHDRPDWMQLAGYVDHASAMSLATESACTIVVVPDCRHGRASVPGKTFELLALPTHLLALVPPDGDTARIVEQVGGSTVVPFEDCGRVASAIERIVDGHFGGRLVRLRDWPAVDTYDRRAIAGAFAECLTAACEEGPSQQDDCRDAASELGGTAATDKAEVA